MQKYIGTKIIQAEPAFRVSGGNFTNVIHPKTYAIPEDRTGQTWEDGYKVEYPDGYVSWSPKDVFEEAYRLVDGMNFGLAIEAMKNGDDDVAYMVSEYNYRRKILVEELNNMGLHCFEPKGAFYAFPSIQSTGLTSEQFCEELLKDQKVAVVPGNAFGESGEGFVRISYAYSIDAISNALEKIDKFISKYR